MNTMVYESFKRILLKHNTKDFKYLLAISGGIDSMVLLDLFRQSTAMFQVAHCNFQLRGKDADLDQALVRTYCGKYNIPYHTINFDVESYKKTGNYSTEMACRNLRYNWFDEVMKLNQLDYLVTAHHLDDNIETFLINLSRGTGISGLRGMKLISETRVFRPLLDFTKKDILNYADSNQLEWREDYTNQTDDFTRNKIRHHITPVLKEIHPNFESNFKKTIENLSSAENFIRNQMEKIRNLLIPNNDYCKIKIDELNQLDDMDFIQFYLFDYYGFKSIELINKLKVSENSSEVKSATHRLIKDREFLILQRIHIQPVTEIIIEQDEVKINSLNLKFICSDRKLENALEVVDASLIQFPLKLRKAKEGDYFYPIGMRGQRKRISKFYKDLKFSKIEKEETWLLVDHSDQIIWVVNQRLDHRFRMQEHSMNFLNIIVC